MIVERLRECKHPPGPHLDFCRESYCTQKLGLLFIAELGEDILKHDRVEDCQYLSFDL